MFNDFFAGAFYNGLFFGITVTVGGHGSGDDELERLQRRRTALAIKARQEREKRERIEQEIVAQREQEQTIQREKESLAQQEITQKRKIKKQQGYGIEAAYRSREQAVREYERLLARLRQEHAAVRKQEQIKRARIATLEREKQQIEEEEEETKRQQIVVEKRIKEELESKRRIARRRKSEVELALMEM
jgi:hypothetical protein